MESVEREHPTLIASVSELLSVVTDDHVEPEFEEVM
jgi:hypothetical protein